MWPFLKFWAGYATVVYVLYIKLFLNQRPKSYFWNCAWSS